MFSVKTLFLLISVIFKGYSFEENLKHEICNKTNLNVDSMVRPFGKDLVFLIAGNIALKLKIKSSSHSEVEWAQKLDYWSTDIQIPIHMIKSIAEDNNYIKLINCDIQKAWIISYETNQYNGSLDRNDCANGIEEVMDSQTGKPYLIRYFPEKNDLVISNYSYGFDWIVRSADDDKDSIKAILHSDSLSKTESFYKLNDHLISSALIEDNLWYLFADRFYCRIKMFAFDECKPKPITDWIENCDPSWEDPQPSLQITNKPIKNEDLSVYVLIVIVIVAVTGIIILVIFLMISKEYKKRGTYLTQTSSSSSV